MLLPLRSNSLRYRWLAASRLVAVMTAAALGAQSAAAEQTVAASQAVAVFPTAADSPAASTSPVASTAPAAATVQSSVEQAAREHLMSFAERASLANAQVRVSVIPRSGAAAPCPQRVTVEPLDTRNITRMRFVAVCGTTRTEYVARGAVTAQVVVAAADITANRPIAAAQLARERRDVSSVPGAISSIDDAIGQASRRAIRAGQVLSTRWLTQPVLVKRGAPVNIVARNAGVEVTVKGEAMEAGRRNEIVHVRNVGNGKVITARVVEENTVEPASETVP